MTSIALPTDRDRDRILDHARHLASLTPSMQVTPLENSLGMILTAVRQIALEYICSSNALDERDRLEATSTTRALIPLLHQNIAGFVRSHHDELQATKDALLSSQFTLLEFNNEHRVTKYAGAPTHWMGTATDHGRDSMSNAPPLHTLGDDQGTGCPDDTAMSFEKFLQATYALIGWIDVLQAIGRGDGEVPQPGTFTVVDDNNNANRVSAADDVQSTQHTLQGSAPKTRTVRVTRYEVHNVGASYSLLLDRAQCYFLSEYTAYSSRTHQRLLESAFYHDCRSWIGEIDIEISRLKEVASMHTAIQNRRMHTSNQPNSRYPWEQYRDGIFSHYSVPPLSDSNTPGYPAAESLSSQHPQIVFRPSIQYFFFLRHTLCLYLSVCMIEDDYSSWMRFSDLYDKSIASARTTASLIEECQRSGSYRDPCSLDKDRSSHHDAAPDAPAEQLSHVDASPFVVLPVPDVPSTNQQHRDACKDAFEAYWDCRHQVSELRRELSNDIKRRQKTHRTELLNREQRVQKPTGLASIWSSAKASFQALASATTCAAEIQRSTPAITDDSLLTASSPYFLEKSRLLTETQRLWTVLEVQGIHLEKSYPGLFFRSSKERWARKLDEVVGRARNMSTVL